MPDDAHAFYCPRCHRAELAQDTDGLRCPACGQTYPSVNGTPILINDANSVFAISDYSAATGYSGANYGAANDRAGGLRALYRRAVGKISGHGIRAQHIGSDGALTHACRNMATRPQVLVIGAGNRRYPHEADVTYTDVSLSRGLHAIADAHDLPFADATFDFVMAIAVLEHVIDPPRVAEEIWRVLKPRGYVYAVTPFLQAVHMGAYDFTRFTYLGHRRLFRKFSDIQSGMALGPGAALAAVFTVLLVSLWNNRVWRLAAGLVGVLLSLPLKYLDYITRRSPAAIDGAAGVFFFGQKQDHAISDREMIKLYRGGFRND